MSVTPELRSVEPRWLNGVGPENPRHFWVHVEVFIGVDQERGSDVFDCVACTRSWLADDSALSSAVTSGSLNYLHANGATFLPGLMLLTEWDPDALARIIRELCVACVGPTWYVAANRLSRYLAWEHAYRYDESEDAAQLKTSIYALDHAGDLSAAQARSLAADLIIAAERLDRDRGTD